MTVTGRAWVRRLVPEKVTADEDEIFAHVRNIARAARQPGRQALSRITGPDGWIVLQAQPLAESGPGGVG
ncbi:hypothetical protein [Streptomyces sp. 303MFCol5.2]|uniref:hypothetical protein n=1 Tax=Streptomyces sp. 303MFCol5.2 TaxID=1172181 RepID=UPI00131F00F4|nr:hypothetical protein [Streptomyces sp. 303MFCol5.2]